MKEIVFIKEGNKMKWYEKRPIPMGIQDVFAVMILLIGEEGKEKILFEERSHNITQPGEVSLPGGRVEEDESYLEAALRETEEETGYPASKIEVIGENNYLVAKNRMIRVFVGRARDFTISKFQKNWEVDRVFSLPVSYFKENPPKTYCNAVKIEMNESFPYDKIPNGRDYPFGEVIHEVPIYVDTKPVIWGLTARIIENFIKEYEG